MRITHLRAANLLTFKNLDLDLTDSPFTMLVGPNGAGKTNVFRLIRLLIESTIFYGESGSPDITAIFDAWKRNPNDAAIIEIDIEWTDTYEGGLLANFIQMVLADPDEIDRALSETPNTPRVWPGWSSFIEELIRVTPEPSFKTEWSGTLGWRYSSTNGLVFYFRPSIANNEWVFMLGLHITGIVPKIPEMIPSSYGILSLASIWIKSLPADTRSTLHQVLKGEAPLDSLSLLVNWPDIWATFQSEAQKISAVCVLNAEIRNTDQGRAHPNWQGVLKKTWNRSLWPAVSDFDSRDRPPSPALHNF